MADLSAAESIQRDQNRQDLLDWLYELDGRHATEHPRHCTYTGLYEDVALRVGRLALDGLTAAWHQEKDGELVILDLQGVV